jgi:hypothetical protein
VKDSPSYTFNEAVDYLLEALYDHDDRHSKPSLKTLNHAMASMEISKKDIEEEDSSSTSSNTPSKILDETAVAQIVQQLVQEIGLVKAYNTLQSPTMRESLSIPSQIWARLEPMIKQKIDVVRKEIRAEQGNKNPNFAKNRYEQNSKPSYNTTKSSYPPKTGSDTVPLQYPSMAAHAVSEEPDNGKEEDVFAGLLNQMHMEVEEEDLDFDKDYVTSRLYHTETLPEEDELGYVDGCLQVRAHFEYAEQLKHTQRVYAISDSGADSSVAGMGAHIINYTGRYAHLLGYDPNTTRSGRIPICSLYIKVKAHNGIPVLLLLHEAPCNITSPVTLISEYQVREFGLVIDSVASKHRVGETSYGTQRFQLNDYIHIPFEDRGGLMGFEILPYEEGDDRIFEVIQITQSTKWTPGRFRREKEKDSNALPYFDAVLQSSTQETIAPVTIPTFIDDDEHFRTNLCTSCSTIFDADHVMNSTWETLNTLSKETDNFLGHLVYEELVGQERCNSKY